MDGRRAWWTVRGHGGWQEGIVDSRRARWTAEGHGDGGKKAGHCRLICMGTYLVSVMGTLQTGISGAINRIKPTFLSEEKSKMDFESTVPMRF